VASCASPAYGGGPNPLVSVVVATFGRAPFWDELLAALSAQTFPLEQFEVVVVDDCSPDGTWETLEKAAAHTSLAILCVRAAMNLGSGAARTLALRHCRGSVVAFTDDDCVPTPRWLDELYAPFAGAGKSATPSLVVQGRTVPNPDELLGGGAWPRTLWVLRPSWLFETCNIAYRTADLEAVGGFPGRGDTPPSPSGRQVGEDALAGWRVVERGGQLVFAAEAVVHHRVKQSSYPQWLRDQLGREVFPALAARSPLARRAFFGWWFLSRRSALTSLALVSAVGWRASRRRLFALGVVPWVLEALPEARGRPGRSVGIRLAQLALGDVVGLWATSRGSIRHRRLVL
jgi:glycosyltransferase involved in cell wall biosynthesis